MYAQKTETLRIEDKSEKRSNTIADGVSLTFGSVWH